MRWKEAALAFPRKIVHSGAFKLAVKSTSWGCAFGGFCYPPGPRAKAGAASLFQAYGFPGRVRGQGRTTKGSHRLKGKKGDFLR